jgi:hypothetical protein
LSGVVLVVNSKAGGSHLRTEKYANIFFDDYRCSSHLRVLSSVSGENGGASGSQAKSLNCSNGESDPYELGAEFAGDI